ncbi:hypothetical protein Sjap_021611 [Stephania japonica]|uniref:Uncharacterized protein n=1 Tax=Stephania japonica TaxID=461633 RepID=A0AAP0EW46_9MAGN
MLKKSRKKVDFVKRGLVVSLGTIMIHLKDLHSLSKRWSCRGPGLLETDRKKIPTTEDPILELLVDICSDSAEQDASSTSSSSGSLAGCHSDDFLSDELKRSTLKRFRQNTLRRQERMEQHYQERMEELQDMSLSFQNMETIMGQMNATLERLIEQEEFSVLPTCDEEETLNNVSLMSVEVDEDAIEEYYAINGLTSCVYEYWSEKEKLKEELEVSPAKSEIIMVQIHEEEAKKEIDVILERPEDSQQVSKEDQSFVLVSPPTLPHIFVDFNMEVEDKERLKTFYNPQYISVSEGMMESFVLEVPDKLQILNKGVSILTAQKQKERVSFLNTLYWRASRAFDVL